MTKEEKQTLIDAVNFLYNVTRSAQGVGIAAKTHEDCLQAAKDVMKHLEGIKVKEEEKEEVKKELKKVK